MPITVELSFVYVPPTCGLAGSQRTNGGGTTPVNDAKIETLTQSIGSPIQSTIRSEMFCGAPVVLVQGPSTALSARNSGSSVVWLSIAPVKSVGSSEQASSGPRKTSRNPTDAA